MKNINNASIIFRLDYENQSFLFMGDAEIQAEQIIAELDTLLLTDIIKVGHYGSSTSSIHEMVGLVNPDYMVISAGENNRYGHPSEKVVQ